MAKENETPTPKSDNELLQEILKNTKSIKDNVQFFAWIILGSFGITVLIFIWKGMIFIGKGMM